MIDLSGKTALVTGAASGIGYGMAKRLAECGANVALCDIESNVHNIANEISDVTSSKVKSAVVDVREASQVFAFTNDAVNEFSGLDIVCLLYTSPSPRDRTRTRMPSSA